MINLRRLYVLLLKEQYRVSKIVVVGGNKFFITIEQPLPKMELDDYDDSGALVSWLTLEPI